MILYVPVLSALVVTILPGIPDSQSTAGCMSFQLIADSYRRTSAPGWAVPVIVMVPKPVRDAGAEMVGPVAASAGVAVPMTAAKPASMASVTRSAIRVFTDAILGQPAPPSRRQIGCVRRPLGRQDGRRPLIGSRSRGHSGDCWKRMELVQSGRGGIGGGAGASDRRNARGRPPRRRRPPPVP